MSGKAETQVVLGVDLDGVCADFYARMREVAAEWFECSVDSLTQDVSYGLPEWVSTFPRMSSIRACTDLRLQSEDFLRPCR